MFAKQSAVSVAILVVVAACQPLVWNKPGASQADFNTDRYQCMKGSQQQTSSLVINEDGVEASSGQSTNEPLFTACMNARGWSLQRRGAPSQQAAQGTADAEGAIKASGQRLLALCVDPKFAPYYSRTPCSVDQMTLEQLADTSKISPQAKTILSELRSQIDANSREWANLQTKYGGAAGAKRVDLFMTTIKVQDDKNNLDLYSGAITWGEFNRRRQAMYREFVSAAAKISS